ncbi:MAG: hypothetical protein DRP56_00505 [Planctomycetota bacterium]|nr:MAG: hypothetical protein DRP56_00505 [Planctomycetota bacterium]
MTLHHAAFQIIEKLDAVVHGDKKKSVWNIITEHIKGSDSFNARYIDCIEKEICSYIKTLTDQGKIALYNETEVAMAEPLENTSPVINSIVMDLGMELLETITDEAWECAGRKESNHAP